MATRKTVAKAKKPAAKAVSGNISVKLATLTKPLEAKNVKKGTTLSSFLQDNNIEFSSNIRVNATVVAQEYKLRNGDIISVVTQVSGGTR